MEDGRGKREGNLVRLYTFPPPNFSPPPHLPNPPPTPKFVNCGREVQSSCPGSLGQILIYSETFKVEERDSGMGGHGKQTNWALLKICGHKKNLEN
jgi:hypothetical protein